jgi:GH24 family phage-related lysozyme (muramidase)
VKLSNAGARFIADFEGFSATPYRPVAGERYLTIGYGHYGPDVKAWSRVTRGEALDLLREDATLAATVVRRAVRVPINQCEFDALVSLAFNIGTAAFADSTVLRELNKRHRYRAGLAFLLWNKGGFPLRVLPGLTRRRRAERRLFRGKRRKRCGDRVPV